MGDLPPDSYDEVDAVGQTGYLPTIVEDQHLPGYRCGYAR